MISEAKSVRSSREAVQPARARTRGLPSGRSRQDATQDSTVAQRPTASAGPFGLRLPRQITRSRVAPIAIAAALLLVIGDFLTGIEVTFALLYLLPIAFAAWFRGRAFGAAVSVLCAAGALTTEIVTRLNQGWSMHWFRMVWNYGGSLVIFVGVAVLVARLRQFANKEQEQRRATVEQLRQAERLGVVGQLAAGVAHELGTPLNVIVGHAEMLDSDRMNRAMLRSSSAAILGQTEKMTGIIRGLLDFSRRGGAEKSEVDLAALAADAASLVQTIAKKHRVEVEIHLPEDATILVYGNRTELEQVLVNLMMNGIQAMPSGGTLRIRVRSEEKRRSTPPAACVEIEDDGIGISADSLPQIFDPFFTTKDVGAGTGLGLSVSYGIVSDHEGRIQVSSVLGSGSRFSVLLPQKAVSP